MAKLYPSTWLIYEILHQNEHYDYHVEIATEDICTIQFIKEGEVIGEITDDGPLHGISKKYPKNMRLARAIRSGFDLYCKELHPQMPEL